MKIFVALGYSQRAVADVTPADLAVFQRVLDGMQQVSTYFYDNEDIVLSETPAVSYSIKLVPSSVRVLPAPAPVEEKETANG